LASELKKRFTEYQPNLIMDFDLLSDILSDCSPELTGNLLQNLPDRSLTHNVQDPSRDEPEEQEARQQISAPNMNAGNHIQAGAVLSKIEDIFESIADGILQQKHEVVIRLKSRRKPRNQNIVPQNGTAKEHNEVRFPSRSPQESWKFGEFRDHMALTSAHRLSRLGQNPRAFT
jgi:meiotic recombination protein SPO11